MKKLAKLGFYTQHGLPKYRYSIIIDDRTIGELDVYFDDKEKIEDMFMKMGFSIEEQKWM